MPLTESQQASLARLRELGSPVVSDALRDLGHPDHIAAPRIHPASDDSQTRRPAARHHQTEYPARK